MPNEKGTAQTSGPPCTIEGNVIGMMKLAAGIGGLHSDRGLEQLLFFMHCVISFFRDKARQHRTEILMRKHAVICILSYYA
jgi:hypothetical protein